MDTIVHDSRKDLDSTYSVSETEADSLESQSCTEDESSKVKSSGKSLGKSSGKSSGKNSAKGKHKSKDKAKRTNAIKAHAKEKERARSKAKAQDAAKAKAHAQKQAARASAAYNQITYEVTTWYADHDSASAKSSETPLRAGKFPSTIFLSSDKSEDQNLITDNKGNLTLEPCATSTLTLTGTLPASIDLSSEIRLDQSNAPASASNKTVKRKKETKTERERRLKLEKLSAEELTLKCQDSIRDNFGIEGFEATPGINYDYREDGKIPSISGDCVLQPKRKLQELVGQIPLDAFVQYDETTALYTILIGKEEPGIWHTFGQFTLDEVISLSFARLLRKYMFKTRKARIYAEQVWAAVLCYVASNEGSNESLSLLKAYERCYCSIGMRRFEHIVHDQQYQNYIRLLTCILLQTLDQGSREMMRNYFNTNVEYQQLRKVLQTLNITEFFAFDGTVCNVSPTVNLTTEVKSTGSYRTAIRAESHYKFDKDGRNYGVKLHASYDVQSQCYSSVTVTQAVDSENQQLDVKTIAQLTRGVALVLGDRAGMSMLLFERFRYYGQYFIIRTSRTLAFPIIEAYTKDGTPLPALVGQKANSPLVDAYAKEFKVLELVLERDSQPITASSIREDDRGFIGPIREGVRQPSIKIHKFRLAVTYRELLENNDSERIMCLATNLPMEDLNAECITDLYGFRWMVENSFKGLKQGNFLQKCSARKIGPVLSFIYASLVCLQLKSFIGNYIRSHTDVDGAETDYQSMADHMIGAMNGLVRRRLELLEFFQFVRSRAEAAYKCITCNMEAIKAESAYPAKRDRSKHRIHLFTTELLNELRAHNNRPCNVLLTCNYQELKDLLNGAIEGNESCIAVFKDFDDMFSSFGTCETVKVFEEIRAKCVELNISVASINRKPKIPKRISFLKEQQFSLFGHIVAALYLTDYQGNRISNLTLTECLNSIKDLFWRECKASHLSIKVYERRSTMLLKALACAIHGGFDFPSVPPAPYEVEYEQPYAYRID